MYTPTVSNRLKITGDCGMLREMAHLGCPEKAAEAVAVCSGISLGKKRPVFTRAGSTWIRPRMPNHDRPTAIPRTSYRVRVVRPVACRGGATFLANDVNASRVVERRDVGSSKFGLEHGMGPTLPANCALHDCVGRSRKKTFGQRLEPRQERPTGADTSAVGRTSSPASRST